MSQKIKELPGRRNLSKPFKGTVTQIEKALINDCLRVSKVP